MNQVILPPGSGFAPIQPSNKRRLICAVTGMEKTGKTHFSLTGKGPVFYHNFDLGYEGVVEKFLPSRQIYVASYSYTSKDGKEAWNEAWTKFQTDFKYALKHCGDGTVVVDTETACWELIRLLRLGKLTQVMAHNYGPVNMEYYELLSAAYNEDVYANVVFLRKFRPVYINDKRTANYEASGYNGMSHYVQANFQTYRDTEGNFHLFIVDCRLNMPLSGMDLTNEMCNLEVVLGMVYA